MSNGPIDSPRMQRAVFDSLDAGACQREQNADGTFTVYRDRGNAMPYAVHIVLVDGPLFDAGQVALSPGLEDRLVRRERPRIDFLQLLDFHCGGHWGTVSERLAHANDAGVRNGQTAIVSSYRVADGTVTIATAAGHSTTTLVWSGFVPSDDGFDPAAYARERSTNELAASVRRAGEECEEPRHSLLLEAARRLLDNSHRANASPPYDSTTDIDLSTADWWRIGDEHDAGGIDARILATLVINGISFHVLGIELYVDAQGVQRARQGDDFDGVYAALGDDGPWRTVEWEGREYGLVITPFCA